MEKKKILLIDDEEAFSQLVKFNLEETGKYEVKAEPKGVNGLAACKKFKPDLILLDIMMPDMPGDKIAFQIKECEDTKNIPIVFLTAIVTKEETETRNNVLGGYPILAKPVSIEKLIEVIEKNIG